MAPPAPQVPANLVDQYKLVRDFTQELCRTLTAEDCTIQSMPDVSPTRWHLAHTTWFFETFVLSKQPGYKPFDPSFAYLFNSYYNTLGAQFPRASRGLLSRPGLSAIWDYRRYVDEQISRWLECGGGEDGTAAGTVTLGLNHEQQHQELMLTDIKHVFSCHPLFPVYRAEEASRVDTESAATSPPHRWLDFNDGIHWIGNDGAEFCFDNETPRHRVLLEPYALGSRLITCGEYLDFMRDGGYGRPELWLSLGWHQVQQQRWNAPMYWLERDGVWFQFTLAGLQELHATQPVCHVSFFEADAFARWAGARLPTEAEWEVAAQTLPRLNGHFADVLLDDSRVVHPVAARHDDADVQQMFGDVWEWTASPYTPYPGFRTTAGALGEYNGKFMCNQYVLRGGSCATPGGHIRSTYRNFFPPETRWQFSGIRLARDVA